MNTKICKTCQLEKILDCFSLRTDTGTYRGSCKVCYRNKVKTYAQKNKKQIQLKSTNYYFKNKDKLIKKRKDYYNAHRTSEIERNKKYNITNKEKLSEYNKDYRTKHKDEIILYGKMYRNTNKEKIKIKNRIYSKNRKEVDVLFKLRSRLSASIANALKTNNGTKNKKSIKDFLSYSIQELKEHLEIQFEPWMNWGNYGKYKSNFWNDQDASTWKWNIDHIIPQSLLPYTSMSDDNFKKCWALENLRPLSAKQNIIEGANKIRHAK